MYFFQFMEFIFGFFIIYVSKVKCVKELRFFHCSRTENIRELHLHKKLCFQFSTTGHYVLVESGEIYKIY